MWQTLYKKKGRVVLFKKKIIWILLKKSPVEKTLFLNSHALRIACAIEGSLDHCCVSRRSWASQVYVHSVVIHWSRRRGTTVAPGRIVSLPFWSFEKKASCKNEIVFTFLSLIFFTSCFFFPWFLCFACSSKSNVHCGKITFVLLSFFLMFLVHSFSPHVLPSGSDGRWQNTSSREMSEGSGGTGHQVLQREVLCWLFFFFLSMTEGPSRWTRINQGECVGWLLHATFGSNSVFSCDSVTCVWHRQPKGHPASECWASSPCVLSLSLSPFWLS